MLRLAAVASSRAVMRLAVAPFRPSIIHRPVAPIVVTVRPLLSVHSFVGLPRDFSRGYARGSRKAISSEDEDFEDDVDEEFEGEDDFDGEDFDEEMNEDDDEDEDDEDEEAESK